MKDEALYLEKRKFVRYKLKARGEMRFEDGTRCDGEFLDISVAGVFLETPNVDAEAVNQFVTISMNFEANGELQNFMAECKIVRVTDTGVGMLLGKMDEKNEKTFHDLMKTLRENLIKS